MSEQVDMSTLLEAVKALLNVESPADKEKRRSQEFSVEMNRVGEARRAAEEAAFKLLPPPPPPEPRSASLGPPCPFEGLPLAELTADQRFAVRLWDSADPAMRDEARAVAIQPGELSETAIDDIADYCSTHLTHDEYATLHVSVLRQMYECYPSAKTTKGANDRAFYSAFAGAGLIPDTAPNLFQVRQVDAGLDFASAAETHVKQDAMLVPGLLPACCQVVFVGDQASGKTTAVASLLAAVSQGKDWLGRPTMRSQCAIVNFDGRDADLQQLLREAGDTGKVGIASYPEHNRSSDRFWAAIERRYGNGKPALIAIDSLSRGNPHVDEKDARFAAPILRAADISSRHPITFIWLHHTPVTVRGNGLNDWLRGTSALGAAFDIGFGFSKVSASASPRETILKVQTLKMRPKGIVPPAAFKLRVTDAGLALYEEKAHKAPLTDEDLVYEAIKANPGIGGRREFTKATGLPRERVETARVNLLSTGRVENKGTAGAPEHFPKA